MTQNKKTMNLTTEFHGEDENSRSGFHSSRSAPFKLMSLCLFFILAFSFFSSCSRTEPIIEYGFISLVYFKDRGEIKERFSFFVLVHDDDGIDNLDSLYLYNDFEQLRWDMQNPTWMTFNHNERTWIGSWHLSVMDNAKLPRGQYRAVLINKGGERTQRYLSFDAPEENRHPFPEFTITDGEYTATSSYPDNRLICYDLSGAFVATVKLPSLNGNIASLNLPSNARMGSLWAEDPLYFTSAVTDIISVR